MGEFKTVKENGDEVKGLHNCRKLSPTPQSVYIMLCKHGKTSVPFVETKDSNHRHVNVPAYAAYAYVVSENQAKRTV